jgi:RNA polymerase sigma factor (sigma-70 family)
MEKDLKHLKELVVETREGNTSSFDEFYNLTKNFIYYSIVKIVNDFNIGEDILQDTYVYFLKNINHINLNDSPVGYLLITAKHLSLDYIKKRNKEVELDEVTSSYFAIDETYSDLVEKIKKILNEEEVNIFLLHILEDLTFKEISSYLSKPLGTVEWKYNEALKKVRKELNINVN